MLISENQLINHISESALPSTDCMNTRFKDKRQEKTNGIKTHDTAFHVAAARRRLFAVIRQA